MIFTVTRFADKKPHPCILELKDQLDPILLQKGCHVIYGLRDPGNQSIYYIGRTTNFMQRMKQHCIVRSKNNALDKRKIDIFESGNRSEIVIFQFASSEEHAEECEMRLIKKYQRSILNQKRHVWKHIEKYPE